MRESRGQVPMILGFLLNPIEGTFIERDASGASIVPDLVWVEIVPLLLPVAVIV